EKSWVEVTKLLLLFRRDYSPRKVIPQSTDKRFLLTAGDTGACVCGCGWESNPGPLAREASAISTELQDSVAVTVTSMYCAPQVFQLAAHLVYWGKAIIIYPLCENNFYMLSPDANISTYSPLADQFAQQFPGND
uniref:GATOR complex protein NPRL3 n=1 Tax=Callorhinchus milii TaxID=7868 RepID=A0A4W3GQW3_CALMI